MTKVDDRLIIYKHVSKSDLGDSVILQPRVPETADRITEGDIPRICVSDDLGRCIRSIISSRIISVWDVLFTFRKDIEPFEYTEEWIEKKKVIFSPAVYGTDNVPYTPPNVSDFRRNKEKWFISDTEFKRLGFLDLNELIREKVFTVSDSCHTVPGNILLDQRLRDEIIKF